VVGLEIAMKCSRSGFIAKLAQIPEAVVHRHIPHAVELPAVSDKRNLLTAPIIGQLNSYLVSRI
jgi:hypothetical protein